MKPIKMIDINSINNKLKKEIDREIALVIKSGDFVNGSPVKKFSKALVKYLNVSHVIPCGNGTDALQIALMALDLEIGDEVIIPSFSYAASCEAIGLLRLTAILVDVDPQNFCIDLLAIEKAITPKTKVIIPVHLFGQAAPMEGIMAIAEKYKLYVIEDNAQAMGCNYKFNSGVSKKTGTIGTIGITSFYPTKNIGCFGDGGALFVNSSVLAERIMMIANHGQRKKYHHEILGCNSRLDSIQAAVLFVKLKYLDLFNARRQEISKKYDFVLNSVPGISIPFRNHYSNHTFHQYTIKVDGFQRSLLEQYLADLNIPFTVYYKTPIHKQGFINKITSRHENLNITEKLAESVLSLPMHHKLSKSQLEYITNKIASFK